MAKQELLDVPKLTLAQMQAMEYMELRSTLTPRELETFDEIERHQTEHLANDLTTWWERGRKLADVKKQAEQGKFYGQQVIEKYAVLLQYKSTNALYAMIRVATVWPTKEQYRKQIVNRQNGAFMLVWAHVCLIAGLADAAVRSDWIDRTIEENWDPRMLHQKLSEAGLVEKSNNAQGRPPALPGSVADAMRNIRMMSAAMVRKTDGAWLSDKFNVVDEFDKLSSQLVTEQLYLDIDKTLTELSNLGDKVAALINGVAQVRDNARERLELHGQTVPQLSDATGDVIDGTATTPQEETTMAKAPKKAATKKAAKKAAPKKKASKKSK